LNEGTARLLTNLILHTSGYGLKGIYSLEEYYAKDLQDYYDALTVGESHNYYQGRAEADITQWVAYFCNGMAEAFAKVRLKATEVSQSQEVAIDHNHLLRELDHRQKQVLELFRSSRFISTKEIATLLKINPRTALNCCHKWSEEKFIIQRGSNKARKHELAKKWLPLIM